METRNVKNCTQAHTAIGLPPPEPLLILALRGREDRGREAVGFSFLSHCMQCQEDGTLYDAREHSDIRGGAQAWPRSRWAATVVKWTQPGSCVGPKSPFALPLLLSLLSPLPPLPFPPSHRLLHSTIPRASVGMACEAPSVAREGPEPRGAWPPITVQTASAGAPGGHAPGNPQRKELPRPRPSTLRPGRHSHLCFGEKRGHGKDPEPRRHQQQRNESTPRTPGALEPS